MNDARTDPLRQDARCDVNLAKLVTALGLRRIRFLAAPPTGSDCAELDAARARGYLLLELTRGGAKVRLALEIRGATGAGGYLRRMSWTPSTPTPAISIWTMRIGASESDSNVRSLGTVGLSPAHGKLTVEGADRRRPMKLGNMHGALAPRRIEPKRVAEVPTVSERTFRRRRFRRAVAPPLCQGASAGAWISGWNTVHSSARALDRNLGNWKAI